MNYLLPIPLRRNIDGIEQIIFNWDDDQKTDVIISYIPPNNKIHVCLDSEETGLVLKGQLEITSGNKSCNVKAFKNAFTSPVGIDTKIENHTESLAIILNVTRNNYCSTEDLFDDEIEILPREVTMANIKMAFSFFTTPHLEFIIYNFLNDNSYSSENNINTEIVIDGKSRMHITVNEDRLIFGKILNAAISHPTYIN